MEIDFFKKNYAFNKGIYGYAFNMGIIRKPLKFGA